MFLVGVQNTRLRRGSRNGGSDAGKNVWKREMVTRMTTDDSACRSILGYEFRKMLTRFPRFINSGSRLNSDSVGATTFRLWTRGFEGRAYVRGVQQMTF